MRTTTIINNMDKNELLKWKAETNSMLNELNWRLMKAERALYLHQSGKEECIQKLQTERKRAEETRMALQFLSTNHPLRHKCQDDLYRAEIRIFRLENKLKKFSSLKLIQLEVKKLVLVEEIRYYQNLVKEADALLNPVVVLRKISNSPNVEEIIFQHKEERPVHKLELVDEFGFSIQLFG